MTRIEQAARSAYEGSLYAPVPWDQLHAARQAKWLRTVQRLTDPAGVKARTAIANSTRWRRGGDGR